MVDKSKFDEVQRELELIRELREKLSLSSTLARAEAKADWDQLERRFQVAEQELERLGHDKGGVHGFDHASRELLAEIRRGYERMHRRSRSR